MADYSRLGGTADSADFLGLIARPVSEVFRHFFAQIATEYDDDHVPPTELKFPLNTLSHPGFEVCFEEVDP